MSTYEKWAQMPMSVKTAVKELCKSADIDIEALFANRGEEKDENVPMWIRLDEAAKTACVSPWTVRRWCTRRWIQWRKLNRAKCGRILISRASLMAFIDGMRNEGGAA